MPDEYLLIRAARYLGVAPWDLAERSILWREWALVFEAADVRSREIARNIAEQREEMANGGGKTAADIAEEAAWKADLRRQIEAQGGVWNDKKDEGAA